MASLLIDTFIDDFGVSLFFHCFFVLRNIQFSSNHSQQFLMLMCEGHSSLEINLFHILLQVLVDDLVFEGDFGIDWRIEEILSKEILLLIQLAFFIHISET